VAARRLGADLAQLRAALAGRANGVREHATPRGLRLDQAAAAWHALTSPCTVEVMTGPAEKATDCNIFVRCCRARYGLCR
jgi:hypothetical protein